MDEVYIPPHSEEAEMAVLSAMLQDKDVIPLVLEKIDAKAFYQDHHQKIFEAILELYEQNKPVDVITLTDFLRNRGKLEEVGGATYLASLVSTLPSPVNAEHYVNIVKEKAILRGLMKVGRRIMEEAQKGEKEVEKIIDEAEKEIFDLAQRREARDFVPIQNLIGETLKTVEALTAKKELVTGVPTGFQRLDFLTTGFHPGELIVVAGRPGMGKSSFVLNIALHASLEYRLPVAVFSLEMDSFEIARKLLCMEARVDLHRLRQGFLEEDELTKLTIAGGRLYESPLFIDDTPSISPLELRAKARRLRSKEDVRLLIVDYLQLMRVHRRVESRQQEIAEISFSLKSLAKELGIPIIAVSQLSRRPEERHDNRPRLSDLRESGAIEQDADVVILLYRRDVYEPDVEDQQGICEVNLAKQRNGPVATFNLHFIKEYTRFEDISFVEEGYPEED